MNEPIQPAQPMLLGVKDLVAEMRLSRSKVYELMASGALPTVRFGKSVRVRRAALERYLQCLEEEQNALAHSFDHLVQ